jgi:hypothetical protein
VLVFRFKLGSIWWVSLGQNLCIKPKCKLINIIFDGF